MGYVSDISRRYSGEIINQQKTDMLEEILHKDFQSMTYFGSHTAKRLGIIDFRNGMLEWFQAFPDHKEEILSLTCENQQSVAHLKLYGTHEGYFIGLPPSNLSINVAAFRKFDFKNHKIVKSTFIFDSFTLISQIGELILKKDRKSEVREYLSALKKLGLIVPNE